MTTHTDQPPSQAGNRAWHRFLTLVREHFETVCWNDADGKPTLVSLIDLASGQAFSLVPHDWQQDASALVLLAMSALDGSLSARGPLPGPACANHEAVGLATTDDTLAATCPAVLHPPARGRVPVDGWIEVPEPIAQKMWAPPPPAEGPVVLVLVDLPTTTMAAIGPFDTTAEARGWHPEPQPDHLVDRLVLTLT